MSQRTEEIADELERIRERSGEDIAVLIAALIGAMKSAPVDSRHAMDRDQLAAMANSLAQAAAQSGDPDNAVAIASIQAEIESLSDADLQERRPRQENAVPEGPSTTTDASVTRSPERSAPSLSPPSSPQPPQARFAHPIQHLLGLVSICALSYAGYIAIESIFKPGSIASWVLTASSTLLAVSIALRWRRFVTLSTSALTLKTTTAALVLCAGCAVGYSLLMLHPTLDATQKPPLAEAPVGTDDASSTSRNEFFDGGGARRPGELDKPIALWWMGESGQLRARARPTRQAASPPTDSATAAVAAVAADSDAVAPPAPKPVSAPSAPLTRQERYQAMLDRDVVVTDATGALHHGTLTGVSSEGVTLRTEVMMFGEPILAHRLYLYDNVEAVEPD